MASVEFHFSVPDYSATPQISPDAGWISEEGKIGSPGKGFWSRFTPEAQAVRYITAIPKIKGLLGPIRLLWHSRALVEQSLKDLLSVRVFLSELCKMPDVTPEMKQFMALQALSTLVAYREPDLFKSVFHSFTFDFPNLMGEPVTYRLSDIIDLGGGMKAFGFICDLKGESPILLYHGTFPFPGAPSHLGTIMADFEREGPGFATFQKNKEKIQAWLTEHAGPYGALVSGHSLGASLGIYTGVFLANDIKTVAVFNAPGVNKETHDAWEVYCEGKDKTQIDIFNPKGDIVPRYGGNYTVGVVHEGFHEKVSAKFTNEVELHIAPLFLKQGDFVFRPLQPKEIQTQDLRHLILAATLAAPIGAVIAGLTILISHVIVPAITALVVAGTWPVLVIALASALIMGVAMLLIYSLVKRRQERQITEIEQELSKLSQTYKTIDSLRRALAEEHIIAREFAYYYAALFYSAESETGILVPFNVALIRELAVGYQSQANVWAPKTQDEAIHFFFHPEKYVERVCAQVSDSTSEVDLRKAWTAVNDPLFFQALERAITHSSQIEEVHLDLS